MNHNGYYGEPITSREEWTLTDKYDVFHNCGNRVVLAEHPNFVDPPTFKCCECNEYMPWRVYDYLNKVYVMLRR